MLETDFKPSAEKPFKLAEEDQTKIDEALSRYLHMDEKNRTQLIHDIEMTGGFRQIGYGSLIGDPASETDKEYSGIVKGWEKGPFCKDRAYLGTPDSLGVAMGALPTEDNEVELPGVVLEINSDGDENGNFADRVLKNIKDFAYRETGPNPIYKYEIVDVETHRHGTVKAIICAADPENPLYLGRDDEVLTIEEKAAIIATSIGDKKENGQFYGEPWVTGMSYWRDHIHCCALGGFEPDARIKQFLEQAETYRAQLELDDPVLFSKLTALEEQYAPTGAKEGITYANPVYEVNVISASKNSRRVLDLRSEAITKGNLNQDPLSATNVAAINNLLHELEPDAQGHTLQ